MSTNVQKFPSQFPIPVDPRFPAHSGSPSHKVGPVSVGRLVRALSPEISKVGLSEICLSYRTQRGERLLALDNINLQVHAGEFVCIVGPSGCGKSTLLHLIAGLQPQTSGQILIDGKPVQGPGTDRILIFQEHGLFPWLTVGQNVEFGMKMKGIPKAEREEKTRYYLRLVHLAKFEKSYIHQLSGGMRQRVAIARALATEPDVLLMDEPFAALDAQTRDLLHDELERIWSETGRTIIFVTHNVREAIRLGDRVVLLTFRPGRVKSQFPVELPRPRHLEDPNVARVAREILDELRDEINRSLEAEYNEGVKPHVKTGWKHETRCPQHRLLCRARRAVDPPRRTENLAAVLFPTPWGVGESLYAGFQDHSYWIAIRVSMQRVLIGYAISVVLGMILGLGVASNKFLEETMGGLLVSLQSLPSICWWPLALLWYGLNQNAILFVVIMGSLLSVTLAMEDGRKQMPKIFGQAGRNLGAKGFKLFWYVLLPASLPFIVSGLKQGWAFAWRSLITAEMLYLSLGLGQVLMMGRDLNDMSAVIAVMILIIAIGYLVDGVVFKGMERHLQNKWGLTSAT